MGLKNQGILQNNHGSIACNDASMRNDYNTYLPLTCEEKHDTGNKLQKDEGLEIPKSTSLINGTQNCSPSTDKIRIIVARQDDSKMTAFVMKRRDSMNKIFEKYSVLVGVQSSSLRFLYDGYKVDDMDTPNTLQMQDNDIIEVYKLACSKGKCYFKLLSAK